MRDDDPAAGLRFLRPGGDGRHARTEAEIATISGHRTLQEVQRNIKAADQKRLMHQAMRCLQGTQGEQEMSHRENPGDKPAEKANEIKEAK